MNDDSSTSAVSFRIYRFVGGLGYIAIWSGLAGGTALYLLSQPRLSQSVLAATFGVLIALPIVNVIAALAEEARRRDWVFVGLAAAVLALVAVAVAAQLG